MGEEEKTVTAEALDSIFDSVFVEVPTRKKSSKVRYAKATMESSPTSPFPPYFTEDEIARKYEERYPTPKYRPADAPPSPPTPPPTPSRSSYDQPSIVNTRAEIATLTLNTAKACIVFRAVYSEEVHLNIKETIPKKHCLWNDRDRVFEFNPCVLKELKALLSILYKEVQVVGVPKALPSTKFDKLMAKLDKEDKSKVYRVLASKYHPDVHGTGSSEVMTLINEVFKQ